VLRRVRALNATALTASVWPASGARLQGRIYHLTGAAAFARDLAIRAMGPARMLARQDWIYDWRV
jgi:hypothetical protein